MTIQSCKNKNLKQKQIHKNSKIKAAVLLNLKNQIKNELNFKKLKSRSAYP